MSKYLDLAFAMYRNRGDWSDGYNYVRSALRDFEIENDLDLRIVNELERVMELDFVDGRVFRDCEYNYGWIFDNLLSEEEQREFEKRSDELWD